MDIFESAAQTAVCEDSKDLITVDGKSEIVAMVVIPGFDNVTEVAAFLVEIVRTVELTKDSDTGSFRRAKVTQGQLVL